MANERVEKLLLRFEVARQDIQKAKGEISSMQKSLESFKKEEAAFSAVADKAVTELQQEALAAAKAAKSIKDVTEETKDFTKATKEAAKAAGDLSGKSGGGGSRKPRNAVQRFGSEVRALPAIPLTSSLSTDAIGKVVAVLGGLNPVAIGAGAAVGGLIIGLKVMTAEAERFTQAFLDSQEEVIRLVKTGTTAQIQEAQKAKAIELEITKARVEENQRVLNSINNEVGGVGRAVADVLNLGNAQTLRTETQKLEAEQRALELGMVRLGQSLNSTEVAANDLAATLLEKVADAERQLSVELRTQLQLTNLNSESIRKRLRELEAERAATQRLVDSGKLSAATAAEYENKLADIRQEMRTLNEGLGGVDAATRRGETIEATQQYNDDIAAIEEERLKTELALTEKYNDQIVAIAERAAEAAANALRKLEDQRNKLELEFGRDEIDVERKKQYEALDLQIELQREEAKAARDHAVEIKRIRQRANREEFDAVADRDVLAFVQAENRKKEELQDANDKFNQEKTERRIAIGQEQQDLRIKYERERQERAIQYQRDLTDAQAQYQRELQLAELKRQQELAKAQQAYIQDQVLLSQKYSRELQLRQQAIGQELLLIQRGYAARLAIQAAAEQAMINQAARMLPPASGAQLPGLSPSPNYNTRGLQSFDTGGVITRTGAALVHRGELIVNPRRGQSAGGITFNINGTSREQIHRDLDKALRQAGYG